MYTELTCMRILYGDITYVYGKPHLIFKYKLINYWIGNKLNCLIYLIIFI
jgi:hypothetical protein